VRAKRLVSEADDAAIVQQTVTAAKAGDVGAARLYYTHLRPPSPRPATYVEPIDYQAPKTVEEARTRILELGERLARGEVSFEMHNALIDNLKAYLGDKAAEQQKKLDELEEGPARRGLRMRRSRGFAFPVEPARREVTQT
jgi:hypothetical protein